MSDTFLWEDCDFGVRVMFLSGAKAIPCGEIRARVVMHVYNLWFERIHIQEHSYKAAMQDPLTFCADHTALWFDQTWIIKGLLVFGKEQQ